MSIKNKYDFIHIDELIKKICSAISQTDINGVINCCTGIPVSLGEKVEDFIKQNGMKIKLEYGKFPDRPYDSKIIFGDATKINAIIDNENCKKYKKIK